MAPSRESARNSKTVSEPTAIPPKPAGVAKLLPRTKAAAKPAVKKTTTTTATKRPATRAYSKRVTAIKNEESAPPAPEPAPASSKLANVNWQPAPAAAQATAPPTPSRGIVILSPLQSSPLEPSPISSDPHPRSTSSELESLITLGREHVEKELKERIAEEKERRQILAKQKTAYQRYQNYLRTLTDLEDELRELKEENKVDEDMVLEQAELFQRMTMKWAKLFEEYAGKLGITVFDIQRLANAW